MSGKSVEWYVCKYETQVTYGPLRRRDLLGMRDEGSLAPDDWVYADGVLPDWTEAGKIRQLFNNGGTKWRFAFTQPADEPTLNLYLFEGTELSGPITLDQLRELVRQRKAGPLTQVLNWDTETVHVAAELMGFQLMLNNQPVAESPPAADDGDEEPLSQDYPVMVDDEQPSAVDAPAPTQQRTEPVAKTRPAPQPQPRNSPAAKPPAPAAKPTVAKAAKTQVHPVVPARQPAPATVDEAIPEDAPAPVKGKDKQGFQLPALKLPRLPKRTPKKKKPPLPYKAAAAPAKAPTRSNTRIRRALDRFIRGDAFARASTLWTLILALQGLVYLAVMNAVFGMYFGRLATLCLSTFIPFGPTPDELRSDGLLAAGMATAFIGIIAAYPLWYVLRTECVPWLSVAGIVLGMAVGLGLQPQFLPQLLILAKAALFFGGVAIVLVGLVTMTTTGNVEITSRLMLPVGATVVAVLGLMLFDPQQAFLVSTAELPPVLQGSTAHVLLLLPCTTILFTACPAFCAYAIYGEVDRAVQDFIVMHVTGALMCLGVAVLTFYCLVGIDPGSFMMVPLAMLPLSAVNTVVAMVPPVLWMLHPDSAGLNKIQV